ncbi:hypothetical protein M3J09_000278 [Ascochyta lentis]
MILFPGYRETINRVSREWKGVAFFGHVQCVGFTK